MLSFDSVTSATLHRIRVGSDYRRILKNILGLRRERAKSGGISPRFVFNFVMMDSNIHEAPLFVALAKRLGGDAIDFRHVVKFDLYDIEDEMLGNYKPKYNFYRERIGRAAAASGIEVFIPPPFATAGKYDPSGDPACSLEEFKAELRALGEATEVGDEPAEGSASAGPAAAPRERISESAHFFCDRPFSEVMIRDQRDVYPCPWHREKMGVLDGSTNLQEIFFGENFRRVRLAMLDPHGAPGCAGCPIKANQLPTRRL
jgi:MoaA/NifB/PqqE/SkfB family radical SAM enzyme